MDKDISKYMKQVSKMITFSSKDKKEFLSLLEVRIQDFCESHSSSYDSIAEEFGTPNEVAASYIENLDTQELLKYLNKRKFMKILTSILVTCIIVVSLFYIYRLNQLYIEVKNSIIVSEETTITEEEPIVIEE